MATMTFATPDETVTHTFPDEKVVLLLESVERVQRVDRNAEGTPLLSPAAHVVNVLRLHLNRVAAQGQERRNAEEQDVNVDREIVP